VGVDVPNELWIAVVGGVFALLGAAAGYVAAAIQSSKEFHRQKKLEDKKRAWAIKDLKADRAFGVLDRRCDQIEEFIYSYTEDFQSIRHAALYILQSTSWPDIAERIRSYAAWRDAVPRRVYAYGASVGSLGSTELVKAWKEMEVPFAGLTETYKEIAARKEADSSPFRDGQAYLVSIDAEYEAFNKALGAFIGELDNIRAGSGSRRS
jgi:hypothetical protein